MIKTFSVQQLIADAEAEAVRLEMEAESLRAKVGDSFQTFSLEHRARQAWQNVERMKKPD